MSERLAVAMHDVEPRSFQRTREIREWLADRGIARVTLLVIPAADRHPLGTRSPALTAWLRNAIASGDAIAQHGLAHRTVSKPRWPRSIVANWQGGAAAEFPGLGREDTARRVQTGRRLLADIELDPRGFVAPGYAYTRALRDVLADCFDWFADLRSIYARTGVVIRSPALCLGSSTAVKRRFSPAVVQAVAGRRRGLMRVDIHPADFSLPGHVATLEQLLARASGREAVTYDELLG
jgi:predicted deacetylase